MKSFQAIFTEPYTIMEYGCKKNPLNFGVDPIPKCSHSGFSENVLHVKQVHSDIGIIRKVIVSVGGGMRSTECLLSLIHI